MPTLDYKREGGHGEAYFVEGKRIWVLDGSELPKVCLACGTRDHLEKVNYRLRNSEKHFAYFLCRDHVEWQKTAFGISVALLALGLGLLFIGYLVVGSRKVPGYLLQMFGIAIIGITQVLGMVGSSFAIRGLRGEYIGLLGVPRKVRQLFSS